MTVEKSFDGFGQKTVHLQFCQRKPFCTDLFFIVLGARADVIEIWQMATKGTLHLVKVDVGVTKLVIFTDVFTYVK